MMAFRDNSYNKSYKTSQMVRENAARINGKTEKMHVQSKCLFIVFKPKMLPLRLVCVCLNYKNIHFLKRKKTNTKMKGQTLFLVAGDACEP